MIEIRALVVFVRQCVKCKENNMEIDKSNKSGKTLIDLLWTSRLVVFDQSDVSKFGICAYVSSAGPP